MSSKVLVTGGAGFIGSNLTRRLLELEYDVVVLDNLFTGRLENISDLQGKDGFRFVKGSITDPVLLKQEFKDVDYVLHLAAIPSVQRSIEDPITSNEANVTGSLNVLDAARQCGGECNVFC
jgi:UDP-glucose 4-epimerase